MRDSLRMSQRARMHLTDLIDIGLNLAHDSFDTDREAVMDRARRAGVERMLVTGSSVASSRAALALARGTPVRLKATAGIHPHHAAELTPEALAELELLLREPDVLAAGECGLDYFRNFAPRDLQRSAFERQLDLACRTGKPAFLHQRDASDDFLAIFDGFGARLAGGVAHCFTDTLAVARACLDRGLYIGITGWLCDERRGPGLRDVVRYVPRERLLVETDAPYLLPRDLAPKPAGRRNEPAYLGHIVRTLAACRGEDPVELAAATTANAEALFRWRRSAEHSEQSAATASA
jgi:TatD DNase family protein